MNRVTMICVALMLLPWSGGCDAGNTEGATADAPSVATVEPKANADETSNATTESAQAGTVMNTGAGSPAATCLGCHQGGMSLSGRDAKALAKAIRSIVDGERGHPPLALDDTSDEAIARLAEALAST